MLNLKTELIDWNKIKNKSPWLTIIWAGLTVLVVGAFLKYFWAWKFINTPKIFYQLTRSDLGFFSAIIGLLFVWLLINIISYRLIAWEQKTNWKIILFTALIVSLIAISIFPLTSMDVFCYLSVGRIYALHHLSPYLHTYLSLPQDSFFPALRDIIWVDKFTPYGPIAIYLNGLIAWLSATKISTAILGFKLLALTTHGLNAWIMYRLWGRKGFWLYAFNPLIIFELLTNNHNEGIVLFLLLLGLLCLTSKKILAGWWAYIAAVSTKVSAIIFLPFYFLVALKEKRPDQKIKFIISAIFGALIISIVLYYPLTAGNWWALWGGLKAQANQAIPAFYSPLITIFQIGFDFFHVSNAANWGIIAGRGFFLLIYLLLLIKLWFGAKKQPLSYYLTAAYGTLCLSALTWLMPWYLVILITLLIIEYRRQNNVWMLFFYYLASLYGVAYYLSLR